MFAQLKAAVFDLIAALVALGIVRVATEASVRIENQTFTFEHNGEDFSDKHFASLCRFGYSNKIALHTIGFRCPAGNSSFKPCQIRGSLRLRIFVTVNTEFCEA